MTGAIRVVSVERGHDPGDFVMVPFGGAGPLHGCALARLIGCETVLIPPGPGILSAAGLLASDLRAEFSRTCLQRAGRYDTRQIETVFAELTGEAAAWFEAEQVPPEARRVVLQASLRYKDQGFELYVPWNGGVDADAALAAAIDEFHATHERLYTFAQRDAPVEIVTLRVDAIGLLPDFDICAVPAGGVPANAITGRQRMALDGGPVEAAIYDRGRLGVGDRIRGPAIVTQLDATTLLLPGQVAEVHRLGSLIIREERD
jgi:N-methylhydantoinase A